MLNMLSRTILEINLAINKNPNCKYNYKCKLQHSKPNTKGIKRQVGQRMFHLFNFIAW